MLIKKDCNIKSLCKKYGVSLSDISEETGIKISRLVDLSGKGRKSLASQEELYAIQEFFFEFASLCFFRIEKLSVVNGAEQWSVVSYPLSCKENSEHIYSSFRKDDALRIWKKIEAYSDHEQYRMMKIYDGCWKVTGDKIVRKFPMNTSKREDDKGQYLFDL